MSVIPALRRLRQESHRFEASLGYKISSRGDWATTARPCPKKTKQTKTPETMY
jgi:hypothetical protein